MVGDREIDGSRQLPSICFDHACGQFTCYLRVTDLLQPVPPLELVQQRPCHVLSCLCDNVCKRSLAIICRLGHCVPFADFCLSLYSLHVLNWDINMIQQTKTSTVGCHCVVTTIHSLLENVYSGLTKSRCDA